MKKRIALLLVSFTLALSMIPCAFASTGGTYTPVNIEFTSTSRNFINKRTIKWKPNEKISFDHYLVEIFINDHNNNQTSTKYVNVEKKTTYTDKGSLNKKNVSRSYKVWACKGKSNDVVHGSGQTYWAYFERLDKVTNIKLNKSTGKITWSRPRSHSDDEWYYWNQYYNIVVKDKTTNKTVKKTSKATGKSYSVGKLNKKHKYSVTIFPYRNGDTKGNSTFRRLGPSVTKKF